MLSESGILLVVGVCEQDGPLTLRMFLCQMVQTGVGHLWIAPSRVEQEEVIPRLVQMFVFIVVIRQSSQMTFAERQVVEFVFEDDACMEECVLNECMTSRFLFLCERYLGEIISPFVGVVGQ